MAVTTPERAIELVKKNRVHRVTFFRNVKGGTAFLWRDANAHGFEPEPIRCYFTPGGLSKFMKDLPKNLDVTFEVAGG
jgi:hypothetical protein